MAQGIDHAISFFALRAFNFLYDTVDTAWTGAKQTTKDVMAYLGGRHNIWHFLDGGIGPLPASAVSHESHIQPVWSYRMDTNCLRHKDSGAWFELFWLSASILVGGREYMLDDFIRNFTYIARGRVRPTPKTIMYVWSIRSGIWFGESERPVMRIIDSSGELHEVDVFGPFDGDRWERILDNDDTSSEESMDVSSDSEDETEAIDSAAVVDGTDSGDEGDEERDKEDTSDSGTASDSGDSAADSEDDSAVAAPPVSEPPAQPDSAAPPATQPDSAAPPATLPDSADES